jgi:predicted hydrolase (HD superfamily)
METTAKVDKTKNCTAKERIGRGKRKPTEWEKKWQATPLRKDLDPEYRRKKPTNNPIKNEEKI